MLGRANADTGPATRTPCSETCVRFAKPKGLKMIGHPPHAKLIAAGSECVSFAAHR